MTHATATRVAAIALALALAFAPAPALAAGGLTAAQPQGAAAQGAQAKATAAAKKKAVSKKMVSAANLKYTGKAQAPKVAVKANGKALKAGRDYALTVRTAKGKKVSKVKACGAYTATVRGKGAYKGTVTKKFKVWSKGGKKWTAYWGNELRYRDVTVVDEEAWDEHPSHTVAADTCNRCNIAFYDGSTIRAEQIIGNGHGAATMRYSDEDFYDHIYNHIFNDEWFSYGDTHLLISDGMIHHPAKTHVEREPYYVKVKKHKWV